MADRTTISDLVTDSIDTIEAHETVRAAQRRMESQTLRSLIVVEGNRPVGIVKWRDLRSAGNDQTVSAVMATDFPVLRRDMDIAEAHGHLGGVDFDNIPVVDEDGNLVGEVPRGSIVHHEVADDGDHVDTRGEPALSGADGNGFDLHTDMEVVDVEQHKLGKLIEMTNDPSTRRLSHIVVEHGMLRKKHKRIPADTIARVEGDNVVLGLTRTEWGFLSDVEDQDL